MLKACKFRLYPKKSQITTMERTLASMRAILGSRLKRVNKHDQIGLPSVGAGSQKALPFWAGSSHEVLCLDFFTLILTRLRCLFRIPGAMMTSEQEPLVFKSCEAANKPSIWGDAKRSLFEIDPPNAYRRI
ncbi:MAG TPA: helix-turn-helix domain-containing protein [Methanotrichaceae archaeon]|nr:helix-turn-helix domain-containing protein [Methanotrichaceae archaeon]